MCSNNTKKYTREEVKQQMLDYIENKYDMEFEVKDVAYKSWSRDWEDMRAYPKDGDPEDTFEVYRFTENNGEVYYTDFYFVDLMQDEYEEYIDGFIGKYFQEYKFVVGFGLPIKVENSFSTDITFILDFIIVPDVSTSAIAKNLLSFEILVSTAIVLDK